jgi:hypothetical protein
MLVAAAICPAAPLLARELTGSDPVVPELRRACLDAVTFLLDAEPDVVVVVGEGIPPRDWPAARSLNLAAFAPALRPDPGSAAADTRLPISLGLGGLLLDQADYTGRRVLQSVSQDQPAAECAALGSRLAATGHRVAVLAMADGSARRTLRAPGYLDERSHAFDAAVELAIASGDLDALLAIDAGLARELMATGRPAWQVLAGAARQVSATVQVRYRDDPFGVLYLVASLACGPQADDDAGNGASDAHVVPPPH